MTEFFVPTPPEFIFESTGSGGREIVKEEGKALYVIERFDYTDGIQVYFKGLKFPRKGFQFPEAIFAANIIKRLLVTGLRVITPMVPFLLALPWFLKRKIVFYWFSYFMEVANRLLKPYYFKEEYQMKPAKELTKWITLFFKNLGIKTDIGRAIGFIIEMDTAYCFRFQDIMGEVCKENLCANPRKELRRLGKLLIAREPDPLLQKKFKQGLWLIYLLRLPSIRKAFIVAFKDIDYNKMAFTEADRYQVMPLTGYDYFGQPHEERLKTYKILYGELPQPHIIT